MKTRKKFPSHAGRPSGLRMPAFAPGRCRPLYWTHGRRQTRRSRNPPRCKQMIEPQSQSNTHAEDAQVGLKLMEAAETGNIEQMKNLYLPLALM